MNLHAIPGQRRLVAPLDGFRLEPSEGEMELAASTTADWVTIWDERGRRLYDGPVRDISDSATFTIMWDARGIWSIS